MTSSTVSVSVCYCTVSLELRSENVWGGGSCQIMIGQLYILVVSVLYLLLIYDDTLCSYFCPFWSLYFFFLFLLIKSPIDSVLLKHLNIRDGSISISTSVKYSAKFCVWAPFQHFMQVHIIPRHFILMTPVGPLLISH